MYLTALGEGLLQRHVAIAHTAHLSADRMLLHVRPHETLALCFVSLLGWQAPVNNQGTLRLDECDFRGSNATLLVYSEGENAAVVIRNSVLGNSNCERIASQVLHAVFRCYFESAATRTSPPSVRPREPYPAEKNRNLPRKSVFSPVV